MLTKKVFAKQVLQNINTEQSHDATQLSAPQKLILEAAYGVYSAQTSRVKEKYEVEKKALAQEVADLRVDLERKKGDVRVERTRIQALRWAVQQGLSSTGQFLVKPYTEYLSLPTPGTNQATRASTELESEDINDITVAENTDANLEDHEPVESDRPATGTGQAALVIADELPKDWRFPIAVLLRFFERLSPLTTAVLFATVLGSSAAYGNFASYVAEQRVSVEKSINQQQETTIKDLEDSIVRLEAVEGHYKTVLPEKERLERDIGTLSTQLATAQSRNTDLIAQHTEALANKEQEFNATIEQYRQNADEAAARQAREQAGRLTELSGRLGELRAEKEFLTNRVTELETEFETTTAEEDKAQASLHAANEEVRNLRRQLGTANSENRSLGVVNTRLLEAIYSVEKHFGRNNLDLEVRRACFRIHYSDIAQQMRENAAKFNIPLDLEFDRYEIDDYPRRWTNQCP